MEQNDYPKRILPQPTWRKGISTNEILEYSQEAIIGRRIDENKDVCLDDSLGKDALAIKEDSLEKILPLKRVPNLSTNLLGCNFELGDFLYIQKNEGKVDWMEGVDVSDYLQTEENFQVVSGDMFVIGWMVKDFEQWTIPYKRKFEQKKVYDQFKEDIQSKTDGDVNIFLEEYQKFCSKNKNKQLELDGEVRLNHRPTNLNFWHFTIDLYSMEDKDNPIMDINSSWKEQMAISVRDVLKRTFLLIPEVITPVNIEEWDKLVQR